MSNGENARDGRTRREFLQRAVAYATVGIAARSGIRVSPAEGVGASRSIPPDAALQKLVDGNQRFVDNRPTSGTRDVRALREHTADKQEPFAAVLACADSRVPVELVFDQSIGDVFVARVAGNIVTPEIIASLEYAVSVLGVSAVVVLGHTHCGAVKAAMQADAVPGQISSLYPYIRPAVEQSAGNVETAIATNARMQAKLLRTASPVVRQAVTANALKVVAGVYDLATGKVTIS